MAKTKYDDRTRQQIASDVLDEEGGGLLGLFKTTGRYISGDFPRSESRDDPQGRVNRRRKGMELLKQREAEGRKRAARLKREKEQQIAKNEAARKERVRAREQAKIDRQAASVTGRALNATEKAAIADMKRRERLAQQDSAKASTGVLRSSANAAKPKPPAKPKVPAKTASTSTKPAAKTASTTSKPAAKSTPTSSTPASSGPEWKKYKSVAAAKNANPPSKFYMGPDGKKKLAITKEELGRKKGETLTQAYNRFEGKTSRKASSAASTASSTNKSSTNKSSTNQSERSRRFTSPASGRGRRITSKAGGGMMKSKMASKGGARGGKRMPTGMKAGGSAGKKFPDLSGDGKVTQKDILMGKGVVKKQAGGMMKSKMASKGGAKGGRRPGGMQAGGMMKSKGMAKGGAMKKKGYAMGGMTKKGMARRAKAGPSRRKPSHASLAA
jgi:hypothetical protein